MIQRIQSLLLFISAALLAVCFFTPVWQATSNGTTYFLDAFKLGISYETTSTEKTTIYTAILIGLSILLTLFIIFKYKNRILQIRLNMMNTILICLIEGLYFWNIRDAKTLIGTAAYSEIFGTAFYMPLAALVLCIFAGRRIQKDEALVKSVDRIR
jgi:hypothetical protein